MPDAVPDAVDAALAQLSDHRGRSALGWATEPLRAAARALRLRPGRPAGERLDAMVQGHPPAVRCGAEALPVATNGLDGVALLMTLPLLPDLDAAFAELRRVLKPAGTLVLVVPSISLRSLVDVRFATVLAPVRGGPWPHRSALDSAGWLLHAADFAVMGDDRVPFTLPVPDAAAAHGAVRDLVAAAIWPPALPADVRERLGAALARRAGPGRVLPVPLRRLVARR